MCERLGVVDVEQAVVERNARRLELKVDRPVRQWFGVAYVGYAIAFAAAERVKDSRVLWPITTLMFRLLLLQVSG